MKDLAPEITRQRLLIEGRYLADVDRETVAAYLTGIARHLDLRSYGEPTIHATGGTSATGNEGYDAFMPLIDSGISLYVWTEQRFFASLLFTCKTFDTAEAISYTRNFFEASEVVHVGF
jgi:hypothetical protein